MPYSEFLREYRSGVLENIHFGHLSAVNHMKEEIYSIGEDYQPVFFRSASKPFQAIPIFMTNVIDSLNLTTAESALFIASHRGEQYHQKALVSLLSKLQLQDSALACAESYPLNELPKIEYIRQGLPKRRILHNCAGKHLGFLAACIANGFHTHNYCDPEHPLQIIIKKMIAYLSEYEEKKIKIGIDGCGAPVCAIPLKHMAIAYLKLAKPELIEDDGIRNAVIKLTAIMNKESKIISSDNYICTALLQDENIVAKGGAQGVYCLALRNEGISIALKIINGSENPWPNVIASLLEQINYANKNTIERIKKLKLSVKSDSGNIVGKTVSMLDISGDKMELGNS